jgi:TRAP-type C4-dicarboxylate transport system permease small subunit
MADAILKGHGRAAAVGVTRKKMRSLECRRWGRWFDRAVEGIVTAAFVTFVALSFAQVILRYGFGQPLTWSEEVSRYLFVWVVFLGGGVAARYRGHIVLDFLVSVLPPRIRRVLAILMGILSLATLVVIFAWQGWLLTLVSWRQESPATGLPVGVAALAIPVGGLLMAINTVRSFVDEEALGEKA